MDKLVSSLGIPSHLVGGPKSMNVSMQEAFLQDIIENPADDFPRMAFADWLQDHGQEERAEFIRMQMELAKAELKWEKAQSKRCQGCADREWVNREPCNKCGELEWEVKNGQDASYDYFEANRFELGEEIIPGEPGWHAIEGGILSVNRITINFRRGFVCEIRAPLVVLMEHLPRLVLEHPLTKMWAVDISPIQLQSDAGDVFNLMAGKPGPHSPWSVGPELYNLLDLPVATVGGEAMDAKYARSFEAAHDALSVAMLSTAGRR